MCLYQWYHQANNNKKNHWLCLCFDIFLCDGNVIKLVPCPKASFSRKALKIYRTGFLNKCYDVFVINRFCSWSESWEWRGIARQWSSLGNWCRFPEEYYTMLWPMGGQAEVKMFAKLFDLLSIFHGFSLLLCVLVGRKKADLSDTFCFLAQWDYHSENWNNWRAWCKCMPSDYFTLCKDFFLSAF